MFSQIAAVAIFVIMFVMIVWDKVERQIVTLLSGLATIVFVFIFGMHSKEAIFSTLNIRAIFTTDFWYHVGQGGEESSGINWATIIFIFGMMVMVEGLAEAGFFNWLCMAIAKLVHYEPIPIFIAFMVMSAVLSMFIDSITVILFLAAITIELSRVVYFDPIPVIMAEIFCANLGGSATMCGDPPNIIIGTSLGYTFTDFLENTGICAGISLIVIVIYFYLCFRKKLSSGNWAIKHASKEDVQRIAEEIREDEELGNGPADIMSVTNKKYFYVSSAIFGLAIVLLITHATTGLTVAFIGTLIAILTLLAAGKNALTLLKRVDYKTLLFFVGLFVVVGGLEETGVLVMIADFIGNVSGGNILLVTAIIIWVSGIASAFVDNIPFAATMIPVIKSLAVTLGTPLPTLAWCLALGTDIGGSATPIGASANVVGCSVAKKNGYSITWGKYCLYMVPASFIVLAISTAYIWIRFII